MIRENYLKGFENCLLGQLPYCMAQCPFHFEQNNFIEKAKRGSFKAAFKVYRNATGFPNIASALCNGPCMNDCPLKDHGGSIDMKAIERVCLEMTEDQSPVDYNLPPKKERIAIVGGGISGMGALLRLSTKKYTVELFEKTDRTGGVLWDMMDSQLFTEDFRIQLEHQDYTIHLNSPVDNPEKLKDFDAVYVATGKDGEDFGLLSSENSFGDKYVREIEGTMFFAGGMLTGLDPVNALANGLWIGTVIDNYLKTGIPYYPSHRRTTALCEGAVHIETPSPQTVSEGDIYSKEEAMIEAGRCIECSCSACYRSCDLIEYTGKDPLKIRDEVVATTLEGRSEVKATPARRLISMCNQCGLCEEACPENIDMDSLFMVGRQKMHRQGKMPWAFHDFWLRDMAQANGSAGLFRLPEGYDRCEYAFFPGCQLGASEPETVVLAYESILQQKPDTAIFLHCCGIPAKWAGNENLYSEVLAYIRTCWEKAGKPVIILTCPSCMKEFKENLPEIETVSLYELIDLWNISGNCVHDTYCVFDPCSARDMDKVKKAVRNIAARLGAPVTEMNDPGKCCGFGGHGEIANPDYADFVAEKRMKDNSLPYITYCINCRDTFLSRGKDTFHILDLIYRGVPEEEHNHEEEHKQRALRSEEELKSRLYTVSQRQKNRLELKKTVLELFFNDTMNIEDNKYNLTLVMSDELKDKLSRKKILEEDIEHTVDFLHRHNRTVLNRETGTLTGYCPIGYVTYWVEYKVLDEEKRIFEVVNAYSHRIKIELEAVWNGKRQDIDLQ